MLHRPECAIISQIAETMGWPVHTLRGVLADLKTHHGIAVEAAERVCQAGRGKEDAKGSDTVYRIARTG